MNQYGFDGLEQKIGYIYKDKKLLRQAMPHTSFANEQNDNSQLFLYSLMLLKYNRF